MKTQLTMVPFDKVWKSGKVQKSARYVERIFDSLAYLEREGGKKIAREIKPTDKITIANERFLVIETRSL